MRFIGFVSMGLVLSLLAGAAPATVLAAGPTSAEQSVPTQTMSPEQKAAFEALIREYILKNPEVVVESIQLWQERQRAEGEVKAKAAVAENRNLLENNPNAPVAGNPKGDITIVEFFDYRCGYCKRVFPAIQQLIEADGNIRYVFKEFPILGPDSTIAAQAAQAVWFIAPDRYLDFHAALMGARGALNEDRVLEIAAKIGLDRDTVKAGMDDSRVAETLAGNLDLGRTLGVNGTPAFVIGGQLVPGAIDLDTIKELVAEARRNS